jgi:hypothetical protein
MQKTTISMETTIISILAIYEKNIVVLTSRLVINRLQFIKFLL